MIGTDNKDQQKVETAFLVGCKSANSSVDNSNEHLEELKDEKLSLEESIRKKQIRYDA